MYMVWPKEIKKWNDFKHLKCTILHGKDKDRNLKRGDADIYLMNPEGLRWLFRALGPKPERWPFDILGIDESSKFKHTKTQRFKELKDQLPKFRRRYILTGSPAPNGLEDLFGQVYCLDLGRALGRYITHYRDEFFDAGGYGGYSYYLKQGAEQQIYKRIAPLVLRMDEKDYLDLPPLIKSNHYVQLPDEAQKIYNELETDFKISLEYGEVRAANAATATIKLRQVANGGVYHDAVPGERRTSAALHDAKTEILLDLLDELEGQPTFVTYEFKHELDRIRKALKPQFGDVPYIGGGVSDKRALEIEEEWNAGQLPVVIVNPQSAAHGLNMQKAGRAIIWYALTWDLELHDQMIKRIHRQGQTKRVFIHYVIARGTVDEALMSALQRKTRTQKGLLDALRLYYLPGGGKGLPHPPPAGAGLASRGGAGQAGAPPSRGRRGRASS